MNNEATAKTPLPVVVLAVLLAAAGLTLGAVLVGPFVVDLLVAVFEPLGALFADIWTVISELF